MVTNDQSAKSRVHYWIKTSLVLITLILFGALTGCVRIQRIEWKTSDDEIRISPSNDKKSLSVSVLTKTSDPTQKPTIDANRSFAISPSGKRFNIRVVKNGYANTQISPWTSDDIYLIDPSQQTGNSLWKSGLWKLDLIFIPPSSRQPIHSEYKLYTYWYCPIFVRPF
ncbi:MAG: hypothetical protein M3Y82_06070 [Verrucomicrobiota bacterium]|nr:hypothetical protein [Verrucomicrobiota bacterium]